MRTTATDVKSSVVSVLGTPVHGAKMAEPIISLFGADRPVSPKNLVLDGVHIRHGYTAIGPLAPAIRYPYDRHMAR